MFIEYGQFNIQEVLGMGVFGRIPDGSNYSENTGATVSLGNNSSEAEQGNYKQHISYRGEENFYGNIWTWVDGLNQNSGAVYISDHDFKDNTSEAPYVSAGYCLTTSGNLAKFEYNDSYPWLFIPGATGGNDSLPIGDYYQYDSGWRVARLGGCFYDDGFLIGPFCWRLDDVSSKRDEGIGLRLVYIPQ